MTRAKLRGDVVYRRHIAQRTDELITHALLRDLHREAAVTLMRRQRAPVNRPVDAKYNTRGQVRASLAQPPIVTYLDHVEYLIY
jgi:hypothetical protein